MGLENESLLYQQVQFIKDNDDLLAHVNNSIAKVATFLSSLDIQVRSNMSLINSQLEQLDKTLEFLETRLEGTVGAKKSLEQKADLGLNDEQIDSTPNGSQELINNQQQESQQDQQQQQDEQDNSIAAAIPPPPPPPFTLHNNNIPAPPPPPPPPF